jgi:hypothetical protein
MHCRTMLWAVGIAGLLIAPSRAQGPQIQDLRRQIEALQEQLQRLERPQEGNKRVTQLGGARAAHGKQMLDARLYDLSDLFMSAPTYEALPDGDLESNPRPFFPSVVGKSAGAGGMGGAMGGGFFNADDKPAHVRNVPLPLAQGPGAEAGGNLAAVRTSLDDLIQAITSTISPESWDEVGGPASIAKLGNSLIISAEPRSHQQIEALFDLFRKRWGSLRTISVRAYWLWLSDDRLAALLAPAGDDEPGVTPLRAFGLANPRAWEELLAEAPERPGYRAIVTCHNGQTVSTVSGGQSLAVTAVEPVVSETADGTNKGLIGYHPTMSVIREGAAFQVTPISNTSGKFVVLDIHSRVADLQRRKRDNDNADARDGGDLPSPRDVVAAFDRPVLVTQRLSTTLRVPVDRPTMIGGMTFETDEVEGKPNLYLFVVVSVQELRDDQAEAKPVKDGDVEASNGGAEAITVPDGDSGEKRGDEQDSDRFEEE